MKKTLVLVIALAAIFSLSATKKPAQPTCGPFITFQNNSGTTITSIDFSGPASGPFTISNPGTSYSTAIGTFSPTFVIHFAAGIHSGTACFSEDDNGNLITGVSFATNASSVTLTASNLTCTDYTLTISRAPVCPF